MNMTTFLNHFAVRGPGIEPGRVTPPDPKFGENAPFFGENDSESFSERASGRELLHQQRRELSRKGIVDRAARPFWCDRLLIGPPEPESSESAPLPEENASESFSETRGRPVLLHRQRQALSRKRNDDRAALSFWCAGVRT